ncbi:hypothetical protein [Amphibacillus sediminis]|uniref:hypothetical protein n=1 Tax=Amphibacillus sediminis TaxID=360185 RepID=UPI000835AB5E|nr:hypothetical protein [Amphibacillus sediminis]
MFKTIFRLLIIAFIFVFGLTLGMANQSEEPVNTQIELIEDTSINADLELEFIEHAPEVIVNHNIDPTSSLTYSIATFIERTGQLFYEGIIKLVSDLAHII